MLDPHLNGPDVVLDPHLQKEAAQEAAQQRVVFDFGDVIDEKHIKYMDRYTTDEEFWGIGIENETYLALEYATDFRALKLKPERYSVNYTTNFKPAPLTSALSTLGALPIRYPVYLNAHTFLKTDAAGAHRTFYDENGTANPSFTESIHDLLLRECREYRDQYDTSQVYDGDSIEFITQRFYRATATEAVHELGDLKRRWLTAVAPRLARMPGVGSTPRWPAYNHGLVTFLTTRRAHLGICNSGTLHVNLTLPTMLRGGAIADKDTFARTHLAFIGHIQLLEPLFAACYGTPDVFSLVDPSYSLGSLRLSRSRYVSLQSFDVSRPVNGKLLLGPKPVGDFWYNRLAQSPYFLNATIGYDVNFNKFKNHGVEIRFFDWFPEAYLTDVLHVLILLAAHSVTRLSYVLDRPRFADVVVKCVREGFAARLTAEECKAFFAELEIQVPACLASPSSALSVLQHLSDALYDLHRDSDIVQKLAPGMLRPVLVDYNREAHRALVRDVFGSQEIVIRCEAPQESRAPLAPSEVRTLLSQGVQVCVETSSHRCFTDAAYRAEGARIVPQGYWEGTRESIVLGLKALAPSARPHPSQTLMHFAHCFKGQEGAEVTLRQLAPCRFIDYEYMREGERVLSFCAQSGKIGAYLALMAYRMRDHELGLPRFQESRYQSMLRGSAAPSILLIGHGVAGKAAKAVIDGLGFDCVVWDSRTMEGRSEEEVRAVVRGFEVVIHAIRLPDVGAMMRFLLPEDLEGSALRVVCDISCDLGNPRNTLPIYTHYTSESAPMQQLGGVSVIALPNLPALEAVVSSRQFSERLVRFLPTLEGEAVQGAERAFWRHLQST